MAAEPIKKKPSLKVTSLTAPARTSGRTVKSTWKVPSAMTSTSKADRAEGLDVEWTLDVAGVSAKKDPDTIIHTGNERMTQSSINVAGITIGSKAYTRASFYPLKKAKLLGVSVRVRGWNAKGKGAWTAARKLKFAAPNPPSIAAWSFNVQNGTASTTVTAAADSGARERYDTYYEFFVNIKKNGSKEKQLVKPDKGSFTGASKGFSYDYANYQSLADGEYLVLYVRAKSRGYAGDSAWVERRMVIAPPAKVTIRTPDANSRDSTATVTVPMTIKYSYKMKTVKVKDKKTGKTVSKQERDYALNPVDGVRLQALADVEYKKASDIPGSATWTDVGTQDDGQCTALAVNVSDLIPSAGKYSYVRVKSWRFDPSLDALVRYSSSVRVKGLEVPAQTAADDECKILDASAGSDGESVVLTIGFDKKGGSTRDDADGTEVSWSEDADAWISTEKPKTFEADWKTATASGSTYYSTWYYTQDVIVRGLAEGVPCNFKARRYKDGDTRTYGKYSNTKVMTPSVAPTAAVLSAPGSVPLGDDIPLTWTFDGNSPQVKWEVLSGGKVLAWADGKAGGYRLPYSVASKAVSGNVIQLAVRVYTGSGYVTSPAVQVTVAQPPTVAVSASQLTAQPAQVALECSSAAADVSVVVRSKGVTVQDPDGERSQAAGDTVYSGTFQPTWEAQYALTSDTAIVAGKTYYTRSGAGTEESPYVYTAVASPVVTDIATYYEVTGYAATTALPAGIDFIDGGAYDVTAKAVDNSTGLESDEASCSFDVAWAHQAPDPTATVTPTYGTDAMGRRVQSCTIALTPPTGSAESDVYDIYRLTHEGAALIGEGFPLTFSTTDVFAPFGNGMEHAYRIACRTADGDLAFDDFEYALAGDAIRFDFAGEVLELPYDIKLGSSWKKDFEARTHIDGSTEGYWNAGVTRKASLSTDVIRLEEPEKVRLVGLLAKEAAPVFVRQPDGSAFLANVEVGGYEPTHDMLACSFDAVEIDLTEEFALPVPNVVQGDIPDDDGE